MDDFERIFEPSDCVGSGKQVLVMAAIFMEGFVGQASKILEILEILEFPENRASVS